MSSEQRYRLIRELGSGSFGVVYLGFDNQTNQYVAIKRVEKIGDLVSREYEILDKIKNSALCINLLDFFYTNNMHGQLIQNMVFEYFSSNLENLLTLRRQGNRPLEEETLKMHTYRLLSALAELHAQGIAHRDLKPENILLKDETIKLADFGSSKILVPGKQNTPYIVSRYYRAPELLLCCTDYDMKIDIWAAGCIIAEMGNLEPVFVGAGDGEQLFAILDVLGNFSPADVKHYLERTDFSEKFFDKIPKYKPQKKVIDGWFSNFACKKEMLALVKRMLELNSENRITAAEALKSPLFDSFRQPKSSRRSTI